MIEQSCLNKQTMPPEIVISKPIRSLISILQRPWPSQPLGYFVGQIRALTKCRILTVKVEAMRTDTMRLRACSCNMSGGIQSRHERKVETATAAAVVDDIVLR